MKNPFYKIVTRQVTNNDNNVQIVHITQDQDAANNTALQETLKNKNKFIKSVDENDNNSFVSTTKNSNSLRVEVWDENDLLFNQSEIPK